MPGLTTARQSIVQPLIEPLYQGRSAHELLAVLAVAGTDAGLRDRARVLAQRSASERARRRFRDVLANGAARRRHRRHGVRRRRTRGLRDDWQRNTLQAAATARSANGLELEIVFDARSDDLRRPLRQQRLAARAAQADDAS